VQDGLFMIAFSSARGAVEWALLLQLALLRWVPKMHLQFGFCQHMMILFFTAASGIESSAELWLLRPKARLGALLS